MTENTSPRRAALQAKIAEIAAEKNKRDREDRLARAFGDAPAVAPNWPEQR
jgi:hypothetical protein